LTFEAFYRAQYPAAVRLAHLLTNGDPAAEDLVQEAFTALHNRFASLDRPAAYLRVAVVNGCRRWHRSAGREERRLRLVHPRDSHAELGADHLLDAVRRLPEKQRTALVLRYWGGWSEAEIAEALGCRPGTVKSLSSRALDRLRREVER
jgi:RNA polymerase sigma-70 factor (sigma-E family)